MTRRLLLALGISMLALVAVPLAQTAPSTPPKPGAPQAAIPPELALDRTLPIDPAVKTGRLPNGLRYFIRQNARPASRVAMRLAVNGDLGRLFTTGAAVRGLAVAGKSGTAELDPGRSPHSWFIGFAPFDDPQVAIAVLVENSGGSNVKASPLAGAMFRAWRDWRNP